MAAEQLAAEETDFIYGEAVEQQEPDLTMQAIHATFTEKTAHTGMPELEHRKQALSFFEFWPTLFFYFPIIIYWLLQSIRYRCLTVPLSANPGFFLGGMVGESKADNFSQAGDLARQYIAPWCQIVNDQACLEQTLNHAVAAAKKAGFGFPCVVKPDLGCRGAGVRIARDESELRSYLKSFPDAQAVILQELVPWEAEAGVFYLRDPDSDTGRIFSITLKYQPYVFGNGKDTLETLIKNDPRAGQIPHLYLKRHREELKTVLRKDQPFRLAFAGSHSRGAIFRDGGRLITPELTKQIDQISKNIDGFYYGRFDIRFQDYRSLKRGQNFKILEVNGASSEATHIWDSGSKITSVFKTLLEQYRWLFRIGAANLRRGHRADSVFTLLICWIKEMRLVKKYPDAE